MVHVDDLEQPQEACDLLSACEEGIQSSVFVTGVRDGHIVKNPRQGNILFHALAAPLAEARPDDSKRSHR